MSIGASIFLLVIGAILTFAVNVTTEASTSTPSASS